MRCQRCHFENIPGQDKCFQCGSILDSNAIIVDVHPPRMAPWKRPFRSILRWSRRRRLVPAWKPPTWHAPPWATIRSVDWLWGVVLSIIPGLAHLVQRRFREIRWYFVGWLLALAFGLFLYGTNIGLVLIGSAISLHAWIAVQHSVFGRLESLRQRLGVVVIALIVLAWIYWLAPSLIIPDLTGGYTNLTLPYQNIRRGDYLLAWRDRPSDPPLPRGSLVLTRLGSIGRGRAARVLRSDETMVVQVVGLPDETIAVADDLYIVNGKSLDSEKYPVPQWLRGRDVYVKLTSDSYFVSSEYNVVLREVTQAPIRTVCVVAREAVEARAFIRWLPLSRRGFIEEIE